MAKSKNGGTRSYLRGRIGSDVYSVGKNSKGARQQVVRSLAEQVSNPRSSSQMFGRMVMSTVMQAVSALKPIIDHSFDGLPIGQPSISEFIRRNYALVKADAMAHPATGNQFALNAYQEKGVKLGAYIVSNGAVIKPTSVSDTLAMVTIKLPANNVTVGGLKQALGLSAEGYLTYVCINANGNAEFLRVRVVQTLPDTQAITTANVDDIFILEGNVSGDFTLSTNDIVLNITTAASGGSFGVIVSEKQAGAWVHSTCVLRSLGTVGDAADEILPTYPVGVEQFLNGGDI